MRILTVPIIEIQDPINESEGRKKLRDIEAYARISHRSEDKQTDTSYDKFLRAVVLQHGDWSVTEHEKATVIVTVDRGITHEIVRHRIGAYTQESTRFVNYTKEGHEPIFIEPAMMTSDQKDVWYSAIDVLEFKYKELITTFNTSPQLARSVLPNALASKIAITYNLRNWRHFFLMRTSKEAHPQMKQFTIPLLEQFKTLIPILYEDIEPEARQVDNLRKAR